MNLASLLSRLEKLEAALPASPVVSVQPVGRLAAKLDEIISDGERFRLLPAKQQAAELRADLRSHQNELRQPGDFVVRGLHEKIVKLNFEDVILDQLRAAEIRLLAELGHPGASHPLSHELQEILDVELFDA